MRTLMVVLGMAAIVGCGGVSKEKYSAKEAEATKYNKALQDESGKVNALQTKVQSLEQQNTSLQAQVGEAQSEVTSLKEQSKKLSEHVLFKENSSKLAPESKRALDAMADAISQLKDKSVVVMGYTDGSEAGGKDSKRWQLSTARALEVAKYLAGRGLKPSSIAVAGYGATRPVASNETMANRALNRRAEIALVPSDLQLGTVDVSRATVKTK